MKINGNPDGGGGGSAVIEGLSITSNGTYTAGAGVDGYSPVEVDVQPELQDKTVVENGEYIADQGYYGLGTVTVSVPSPQFVTESLSVSVNGTYAPGQGVDGFSQVVVDVPTTVTGWTDKEVTEVKVNIVNLNNDASYVGSYAFEEHQSLKTVSLPNCTIVYHNAFQSCRNLNEVTLPICTKINDSAFLTCANLKSIELPECETVGNSAFYNCYSLSYVSLAKCSSISYNAFEHCRNLYSIYLLSNSVVTLYDKSAFTDTPMSNAGSGKIYVTYNLVDSYKNANNWNFYRANILPYFKEFEFISGLVVGSASTMDSTYLDVLSISADEVISVSMYNVTSLESSTFMNYPNLVSISFPKVTYYGDDTFAGCTSLSEVDINVPSLGDRVFAECTSLKTVNVTLNGLVTIGSDVFSGCTVLTSIYVYEDYYSDYLSAPNWSDYSSLIVSAVPELVFKNGLVYGSISSINNSFLTTLGITSAQVTAVSLPNCLNVAGATFYSCQNLLTVDIPECSYIGVSGFAECIKLRSINLAKCEYIGDRTFQGAFQSNGSNLNLDLPVCSYIGNSAFYWAQKVSTITLRSNSVCSIYNSDIFYNAGLQSIYVPASLVDAYKSARHWSNISSRIFPIE